jgi:predicted transcriptional regulator
MKNKLLTAVEWEIMEAIWDIGGSPSVRQVLEHSYSQGEKAYTTVQTIMNTLEKKGFLKRAKIGLVNFYEPVRSRKEMVNSEMSHLLKRVFNGSIPALANFLINSENLGLEEIGAMKKLLDDKESELRGNTDV